MLINWLFKLYLLAEQGFGWPRQLALARVTMLAKPDSPLDNPNAVRPITIMSILYRQWSRIRSEQMLDFLGGLLPPQVGGIASHLSSDMMMAWVTDILDEGFGDNIGRCGLIVDLTKCFNLIPRLPLAKLMQKMGFPQQYVTAHQAILGDLRRLIDIAGQVGEECSSSVGVPEGCAMSVVCMVCLTAMAAEIIKNGDGNIDVAMFADNWGILTNNIVTLQEAIDRLIHLVEALRMKVSTQKSWVWGTTSRLRKQLKQVQMQGQNLEIKHTAKDLGCDISYVKKQCKVTKQVRMNKAIRMLKRVGTLKVPKQFKRVMIVPVGTGVVGYGSELLTYCKHDWTKLRNATATAIGITKSGANGFLTMAVTGEHRDPQVRLLLRKLRFFRRYFKQFPDRQASFLARLVGHGQLKFGVIYAFQKALNDCGWQCGNHGSIEHFAGFKCNWLCDSNRLISFVVAQAWNYHVAAQMTNRKHFDVETFDSMAFRRSIEHRCPRHCAILRHIASGKYFTNDCLSKFSNKAETSACSLCGAEDSKEHRIYECSAISEVRNKFKTTLAWVRKQKQAVFAFGLIPTDMRAWKLKMQFQQEFPTPSLPDCIGRKVVFTDGTAFFNNSMECCLAGSALICVTGEYSWRLVERCIIPGMDHSSYNGEVFAVFMALQYSKCIDIYTDCSGVIQVLQTMLDQPEEQMRRVDTFDCPIWRSIHWHMVRRQHGDVRIFKVQAHEEWETLTHGDARRFAFFNNQVDAQAKAVFLEDNLVLYKKMASIVGHKQLVFEHVSTYHDFLCLAAEVVSEKLDNETVVGGQPDFQAIFAVTGPVYKSVGIDSTLFSRCLYGETFVGRVQDWWQKLEWGQGAMISAVELYLDFCIFTHSMMPVQVSKRWYELRDQSSLADSFSCELSVQTRAWINFLKWFISHCSDFHEVFHPRLKCMHVFGYSIMAYGFCNRPRLMCKDAAALQLWKYFHFNGKTRRDLTRSWSVYKLASEAGA